MLSQVSVLATKNYIIFARCYSFGRIQVIISFFCCHSKLLWLRNMLVCVVYVFVSYYRTERCRYVTFAQLLRPHASCIKTSSQLTLRTLPACSLRSLRVLAREAPLWLRNWEHLPVKGFLSDIFEIALTWPFFVVVKSILRLGASTTTDVLCIDAQELHSCIGKCVI